MGLSSLQKDKKGIFFTLIAVSLLGIILFSYSITYSYSLQEKASIIETRVDTMNRFLHSVDSDMENAIYISGYRSIVGLTDYLTTNATYVSNAKDSLMELFLNGTVEGYNSSLMANNTFPHWMEKIQEKGNEIGINLTMSVTGIDVYQASPWSVRFSVDATVNLSDQKSTASWSQQKSLYSDVSILGFEDPWYALHTNGMVVKRINQTFYDGNFSYNNDTSNLRDHVKQTYYIAFNASPSFIMRFEDNHNASVYGIESLVNKTEIMNYCSLATSSVDTICWQQDSLIPTYRVQGMNDSNFKIDNETNDAGIGRVQRYGLEDVIY
ncbi:hypothetical protein KY349_00630 [Candidatus Woesearchaeota archaeon]|nr:hypothetical protein [Candidatus Woesearchaeota archaeon]